MIYDVIIIGAGLAGCSTAIQLATHGLQVLLLEQQRYPAHKLCGEFLSIEVIASFAQLGVLAAVQQAGAHPICHARLTTSSGATFTHDLPGMALGLSRYQLDWILFQRAQFVGATCQDGTKVQAISGDFSQGFWVTTSQGRFQSRMVLGAYGKRSSLDSQLHRPFTERRTPWIAFKAHCNGLDLPHTIELHAFPGGYCGLSAIETGQINLCWIAHQRILKTSQNRHLPEVLTSNPALANRLQQLTIDSSTRHSLSQISFAHKGAFDGDIWMIGDTAGMITPLCGDGMAMALRTAELATPLAIAYLSNTLTASALKQQYQQAWQREFSLRLSLGQWMHRGFIQPQLAQFSVALCQTWPAIGDWLIRNTRGKMGATSAMVGVIADSRSSKTRGLSQHWLKALEQEKAQY